MGNPQTIKTVVHKPSALENFSLGFEYDVTWQDAKRSVRVRTQK